MEQEIIYGLIAIATVLILLALFLCVRRADKKHDAFMREQHAYMGEIIGDASTLDRPPPQNPFRKQHPREPEPMGM